VRTFAVFVFLASLRLVSRLFWRLERTWIGGTRPDTAFDGLRVVALLNHTSLFEWLWIGACPHSFLWRVAVHGVIPAAEKTTRRPLVGAFFKMLGKHVVSITRERDSTWRAVLQRIDPDSMVIIAPEGRMKRPNGLDSQGQPMTVRGGIADILEAIPEGPMLLAYSGGLHHVQAPGEHLPRPFRKIRIAIERVDIAEYRAARMAEAGSEAGFKRAVVNDLNRRRDLHCPAAANGGTPG
jgi:1-acyl-sn-glycerol-3-phosphate acyltransferase